MISADPSLSPKQPEIRQADSWRHQLAAYWFAHGKPASMLAMAMGCVAGDATIVVNRAGITRTLTLRRAYELWSGTGRYAQPWSAPWHCRALVGRRFGQHRILDILPTGNREVVKVTLDNGKSITLTPDHLIAQPNGVWTEAGKLQIGNPVLSNGRALAGKLLRCPVCGAERYHPPSAIRRGRKGLCLECYRVVQRAERTGRRCIDSDGYARVYLPEHRRANGAGQVYEHIVVMEQHLGHCVGVDLHVHHKNGDKADNRVENLEVVSPGRHIALHETVRNLDGGRTINGGQVVMVPKICHVVNVEPAGITDIYDMVMAEPHHNFVANGIVVHNCGKSKVAVDLLVNWGCSRVLVLCPVSVRNVWRREFAKWAPGVWPVVVLEKGTVKRKTKDAADVFRAAERLALVLNYESAWREPLGAWLLSQTWDCVILDESHRCGSHSARISKFVAKLADKARRRLCLSGTPLGQGPLWCFGQYRFLDWRLFGKRWTAFKASYAVCGNPYIPQAVTGYRNLDILQERFGRIAFQVGTDVLDLPEASHHTRSFELPPMARRVYREMENDFFAAVEAGTVTAANVLVKTLRLRQICSGFIQPDESEAVAELHDGKTELLSDLLTDLGEPCVVFAEFRHDLAVVRKTAAKLGLVYGELSGRQNDLTPDATMPEGIDVLGVQYQSGGVGVDLSRARYCALFSPTYSLTNHEQALARVHRPGQMNHVHYYSLVAEGTIDQAVNKALRKKSDVIKTLLKGAKECHSLNELT